MTKKIKNFWITAYMAELLNKAIDYINKFQS